MIRNRRNNRYDQHVKATCEKKGTKGRRFAAIGLNINCRQGLYWWWDRIPRCREYFMKVRRIESEGAYWYQIYGEISPSSLLPSLPLLDWVFAESTYSVGHPRS